MSLEYYGCVILLPAFAAFLLWHSSKPKGQLPTPPGPPAKPLIGNILQVPPRGPWYLFTELKHKYGDLVFFHGLGNSVLVLNSLAAMNELLDKRGSNYSHRPIFTVIGELMGLDQTMELLPYGPEWREQRKLAHLALNPTAVKKYQPIQEDLAAILCSDILRKPEDFFAFVRLTTGRIVLTITYGLSVKTADSQYITSAEEALELVGRATVPGAFLCDLIPSMKYLPSWVPFQKEAAQGKVLIESFVTRPLEHVKREMRDNTAPPSLTRDLLSINVQDPQTHEYRVKWSTGSLYGAGGETTYAAVQTFILAMALNPSKQAAGHEELDRVLGRLHMPTIADRPNLPYVNALIKETMRWHPVVPVGLARRSAADDTFDGYFIPKNTIVLPNVWALAFAPNEKYDPKAFIPERFLDPSQPELDPAAWAFGFGRRICPGKALGENSVFILIASILASFHITQKAGEDLQPNFEPRLISYPKPFKCDITPRSPEHADMVRSRAAQCTS